MALTFDDDQAGTLLQALGLPEDTDDVALVVQTAADLASQAADPGMAKPSTVAAAARRSGMEVLDKDTAEAQRREIAEARQIKAAAAKAKVEAAVDDAVDKGKITAGRRKHWVQLLEADPGMADVLASTPPQTAVPLSEIGHQAEMNGAPEKTGWFY
jgi:hypothetical protein